MDVLPRGRYFRIVGGQTVDLVLIVEQQFCGLLPLAATEMNDQPALDPRRPGLIDHARSRGNNRQQNYRKTKQSLSHDSFLLKLNRGRHGPG